MIGFIRPSVRPYFRPSVWPLRFSGLYRNDLNHSQHVTSAHSSINGPNKKKEQKLWKSKVLPSLRLNNKTVRICSSAVLNIVSSLKCKKTWKDDLTWMIECLECSHDSIYLSLIGWTIESKVFYQQLIGSILIVFFHKRPKEGDILKWS